MFAMWNRQRGAHTRWLPFPGNHLSTTDNHGPAIVARHPGPPVGAPPRRSCERIFWGDVCLLG